MKKTHESEEMYLETILILSERNGHVRSCDIVDELNYAKSSVSRGVNLLEDKGYITIDRESGNISLTKEGFQKANGVFEKHTVLTKLLEIIGANAETAEDTACRIEHVISDDVFELIKNFTDNLENQK